MAEVVYLTQRIRDILNGMVGPREKIALFLGERVSDNEIYIINTTGPFEGEINTVSLNEIFHMNYVVGSVMNANMAFRQKGSLDRFVVLTCHSHPGIVGQIVNAGYIGWSVDDIPEEYTNTRGALIQLMDKGNNLVHLMLKPQSDGKTGDDVALEQVAGQWRIVEYEFFVRPAPHLAGKPFTGEVDIECYKYDPQMRLGKIRKVEISSKALTPQDLLRTILDPSKVIIEVEKETGNLVMPYRV